MSTTCASMSSIHCAADALVSGPNMGAVSLPSTCVCCSVNARCVVCPMLCTCLFDVGVIVLHLECVFKEAVLVLAVKVAVGHVGGELHCPYFVVGNECAPALCLLKLKGIAELAVDVGCVNFNAPVRWLSLVVLVLVVEDRAGGLGNELPLASSCAPDVLVELDALVLCWLMCLFSLCIKACVPASRDSTQFPARHRACCLRCPCCAVRPDGAVCRQAVVISSW